MVTVFLIDVLKPDSKNSEALNKNWISIERSADFRSVIYLHLV